MARATRSRAPHVPELTMNNRSGLALLLALSAAPIHGWTQAPCAVWSDDYGAPGFDGPIWDSAVYDDGAGPTLYVSGAFQHAPDGSPVVRVARRTGPTWTQVGTLPANTSIAGLAALDAGSGTRLYAYGSTVVSTVTRGAVYRLDGAQWTQVGPLFSGQFSGDPSGVSSLVAFNSGTGPKLVAGGSFSGCVALWSGTSWGVPGGGLYTGPFDADPFVASLAVHDDGTGNALYAAGLFDRTAGGSPLSLRNVVRWSGNGSWIPLGVGLGDAWNEIPALQLASFPTPAGRRLAASAFGYVVVWHAGSWSTLAGPFGSAPQLAGHEGGAGINPGLLAAGELSTIGSVAVPGRALWDGTAWTALGAPTGSGGRSTFTVWDDGSGERLHAAHFGGVVESLDAGVWTALDPGGLGATTAVGLSVLPGPDGRANLYAGGSFTYIGGIGTDGFARYDGIDWHRELPPAGFTSVGYFAVDLGAGPELHATGTHYPYPPGTPVRRILRRDGSSWTLLPTLPVVSDAPFDPTAYDDGAGRKIFAGSWTGLWRLDGATWTRVIPSNGLVRQMFAFDDGTGEALYLEGQFTTVDGVACNGLARWDGAVVTPLGSGGSGVQVLAAHDFGSGPELVVGGSFTSLGGVSCQRIARWNGTQWAAFGAGMAGGGNVSVSGLASLDDGTGTGSLLVAGGWFATAGGQPVQGLARWNGTTWESIGGGLTYSFGTALVSSLATYDAGDGRGAALYVGGYFSAAGGTSSRYLARWESCGGDAQTFCYGDGSATPCPCLNASEPEERAGCRSSLGVGGSLRVHGRASLSADTLRIEGASMPNSSALYFQGAGVVAGGLGVPFGDGLKCTSGPFIRFATKSNVAGASVYPSGLDVPVSVRGAIAVPGTRYYQVRYRNAAAFCAPETFNYTNGVSVVWGG